MDQRLTKVSALNCEALHQATQYSAQKMREKKKLAKEVHCFA